MANIPAHTTFGAIDAEANCRNWRPNEAGTSYRMGCKAAVVSQIVDAVNCLLAAQPRTVFARTFPSVAADKTGAEPLYIWVSPDKIGNARNQVVRFIALPRTLGTGDSYAQKYNWASYDWTMYTSAKSAADAIVAAGLFGDAFEASYVFERGARTSADCPDGVTTVQGYTPLSVVVQDEPLLDLDSTVHLYCNPDDARPGGNVTASIAESVRANLHEVRQYGLPIVFLWCSQGIGATPAAPGDKTGITVTSTSYVNILDQSVTTRTATSPGQCSHRQYAAVGLSASVPCTGRAFVSCTGAGGWIKFIGPNHVASNATEIYIPAGTSLQWCGTDTDKFYLNSGAAADDATTARNKIDVHAKVDTGGSMTIWNVTAWELYS